MLRKWIPVFLMMQQLTHNLGILWPWITNDIVGLFKAAAVTIVGVLLAARLLIFCKVNQDSIDVNDLTRFVRYIMSHYEPLELQ
jgi:hypothetical protein